MANALTNSRRYDPIPDSPELGDAMRALQPQQRAFVLAYVEDGKQNNSAAARAAGYGEASPTSEQAKTAAKVAGWRLIHDPKILAAIRELAQTRLSASAFHAANVLVEIAEDVTHKDRFRAAEMLMNRAGMIVVNEQKVVHEHRVEKRDSILERIEALAKKHGLDPDALLARRVEDAQFVEVRSLPPPEEAAMSSAGLEDLL